MQQVPQSNLLNPGKIPLVKGYFGFPALSGTQLGVGSSGFSYNEIDQAGTWYSDLRQNLQSGLNRVLTDNEIRLVNFGFRVGKGYLNFDVGEVVYVSGNFTPDLFNMFHDIDQNNFIYQQNSITYDQSQLGLAGANYQTYSVSYAHQVLPNLTAGARFRYLQGRVGIWTDNQNLMFRYPGDGTTFEVMGQMNVLSAGLNDFEDLDILGLLFPSGNSGFAFDLGGVYQLTEKVEFSFSAVNLGQINWKRNVNYQVVGDHLNFSAEDIDDHLDEWTGILDRLVDDQPINPNIRFTTPLPMRFFIGGNYYIRPNTSVGLLINPVRYNGATDVGVAISGNTRAGKILGFSAAIAYNRYNTFNLGVGLSLDLGPLQIYAITDNLFSAFNWENVNSAQAQVGINFNFGKMRREETLSAPVEVAANTAPQSAPEKFDPAPAQSKPQQNNAHNQGSLDSPSNAVAADPGAPQNNVPASTPFGPASPPAIPNPESTVVKPSPPPPTAVPQSFNTQYYNLTGTARDASSGDVLQSISVEVYQFDQEGNKELVYRGDFYNGVVLVPLNRGFSYKVIIEKNGFESKEFFVEAARVGERQAEVKRDFVLLPAVPVSAARPPAATTLPENSLATPSEEKPAPPTTQKDAPQSEGASSTNEKQSQQEPATPAQVSFGSYGLTGATSLRRGPHHTNGVILRLRTGDKVEVLEKTDQWWWKVRFRGQEGYVKAQSLAR